MDQFHQTNHQIKLQIEENIRRNDEFLAKCAIIQQNVEAMMQVDKIVKGRKLSADASCVDR